MYNNPFWKIKKNMLEARGHYDGMGGYVGGYSSGRIEGPSTDPPEDHHAIELEKLEDEVHPHRKDAIEGHKSSLSSAIDRAAKAGVNIPADWHKSVINTRYHSELPDTPSEWSSVYQAGEKHPHYSVLSGIEDAHQALKSSLDPNSVPASAPDHLHDRAKKLLGKKYYTS